MLSEQLRTELEKARQAVIDAAVAYRDTLTGMYAVGTEQLKQAVDAMERLQEQQMREHAGDLAVLHHPFQPRHDGADVCVEAVPIKCGGDCTDHWMACERPRSEHWS